MGFISSDCWIFSIGMVEKPNRSHGHGPATAATFGCGYNGRDGVGLGSAEQKATSSFSSHRPTIPTPLTLLVFPTPEPYSTNLTMPPLYTAAEADELETLEGMHRRQWMNQMILHTAIKVPCIWVQKVCKGNSTHENGATNIHLCL